MRNSWERKVDQILRSERGREALKKYGIDVAVDEPDKSAPVVAILCPTYRNPEPQMKDALGQLVSYSREKGITVYGAPPIQASVVHWSRNYLLQEQIKSGKPWTHVLYIDDDIVVQPDTLVRLLSHEKDVVAGICTRRIDPPVPNIRFFDQKDGKAHEIWDWPENQLIEVDAVGTGLMLLSQHACEQAAQVYFDCLYEEEYYGLRGELLERMRKVRQKAFEETKTCYWFRFLPTPYGDIEMGEDICFCFLLKRYAKLPIFVDTAVQPGHIGNYAYSISDYLPYRKEMMLRAKVRGEYPMEVPSMKISILCPTRGRPDNARRLIQSLKDTSEVMPEVVLYVDDDDNPPMLESPSDAVIVRGPRITLSDMWNRCAEAASGEILMQGADDIVFKTNGWDAMVRRAFAAFDDRLVLVHGDDGVYREKFGTHCFVHRNWVKTTGYFSPPYFSSDYADTWLNEVSTRINRRIFLPFVTEHLHPTAGKAELDKTHRERLDRGMKDNVEQKYKDLAPERDRDVEKLLSATHGQSLPVRQPELVTL